MLYQFCLYSVAEKQSILTKLKSMCYQSEKGRHNLLKKNSEYYNACKCEEKNQWLTSGVTCAFPREQASNLEDQIIEEQNDEKLRKK